MFGIPLYALVKASPPSGGSVPIVSAVSYDVVDTSGGGQRVVVTVNSSTGCTAISAGGVAFTSFAIDDATHVSGIPGAHAAGTVDVVVTNATGPSTTGTGLIEYFTPLSLSPTCALMSGSYAVVGTQGVDAVGTWTDSSGNSNHAVSIDGISAPAALNGMPDFVAANSLSLSIAQSLASSGGSPPDLATLSAGTQIAFFEPDASSGAASSSYEDAVVLIGVNTSNGIVYNDDGTTFEMYDGGIGGYVRMTTTAAATGVKHFVCGRWDVDKWECKVNGNAFLTETSSGTLVDAVTGATTTIGASGTRYFDGRVSTVLVYASAISTTNITKIYKWGRQRGIAA